MTMVSTMSIRLFFFVIFLGVVFAAFRENMHKCGRFMHPAGRECCKKGFQIKPPADDLKECFKMAMRPPSCERELCIAKKRGFATDDGKIDKKVLADYIDKEFEEDPQLTKVIKEKCVNGDLDKYAPADFCDLVKVKFCIELQIMAACSEWDDQGPCAGSKEDAAECLKLFV